LKKIISFVHIEHREMFASRASLALLSASGTKSSTAAARVLFSTTVRRFAGEPKANIPAGFAKLKEKQKFFNVDNGLRVHQRGGASDSILHSITLLLILVGLVEWTRVVYTLAFPPEK